MCSSDRAHHPNQQCFCCFPGCAVLQALRRPLFPCAAESTLLALINKAATPEHLDAAMSVVRVNRLKRARSQQWDSLTPSVAAALEKVRLSSSTAQAADADTADANTADAAAAAADAAVAFDHCRTDAPSPLHLPHPPPH